MSESASTTSLFQCRNCPADRQLTPQFSCEGFQISDCQSCGHRFVQDDIPSTHVENVYGDDYFNGGNAGYVDYLSEGEMLRKRGSMYARILKAHMPAGRMLDVGAAAGFLLKGFQDEGWKGEGVEPNARMAAYGREQLGVQITHSPVEAFTASEPFDLVSMIQVLPHLWNLMEGLEVLSQLTKPGGYWLVETWNKDSFTAKLFGKNWHEYCPPSVLHWFTPDSLVYFAEQFGFEKVAQGRPSKKIQAHHAKSLIRYKFADTILNKPANLALKLIPDGLTLPYPAEDLFYMVLRKKA